MSYLKDHINKLLQEQPTLNDEEIARKVYEAVNPGQTYEGKYPTARYVEKLRKRSTFNENPTEIIIGDPEETEIPDDDIDDDEEDPEDTEDIEEPEDLPLGEILGEEPGEAPTKPVTRAEGEEFGFADIEVAYIMLGDFLAGLTDWEAWRLKQDNEGHLIDPVDIRLCNMTIRMLDKYAPELLQKYFMEIMFGWGIVMVWGSRASKFIDYKKKQKKEQKESEEKDNGDKKE